MHLPAPAPVKQAQHGGHDDDSGDFITRTECHALKENHYFGDRALQGMWSTCVAVVRWTLACCTLTVGGL